MDAKKWFYDVEGLNCCEIVTFQKDLEKGGIRSLGRSRGMELKEVEKILGQHSKEISKILGYTAKSEVVHKDDMVEI